MSSITLGPWPHFAQDEIDASTRVLQSGKVNYWTGQEGREFEKEFATYIGCNHAIAIANGTLALELALEALGVSTGDEVIVSSATFIATASCVVTRGAIPVCADIEPYTQNISAGTIAPLLTAKTKAIICVHLGGIPCDMDPIMNLANANGIYVIEDCAQSIGATYKGKMLGSIGHINAFSFCQDKIMTTGGEGGMVTTNDKTLWQKAWEYKDHGKNYDKVYHMDHPPGFRWLHDSFGSNYRMTEMQSAIGREQLKKLPNWLVTRKRHADKLTALFADIDYLITPSIPEHMTCAWYKYYAFLDSEKAPKGKTRDSIMAEINAAGIPCYTGSCCEIYREKAFEGLPDHSMRHEVAQVMDETSLMFLIHPTITDEQMDEVCKALKGLLS